MNKVVARYRDGRLFKGHVLNFSPNSPHFFLSPVGGLAHEPLRVIVDELKALFWVHDFGGDPHYVENKNFMELPNGYGMQVSVTFSDGEIIAGYGTGCDLQTSGFYVTPVDEGSNNQRIFVVSRSVTDLDVQMRRELTRYGTPLKRLVTR